MEPKLKTGLEMLLRMYLRWCETKGFKVDLIENSPGDVAGIKVLLSAIREYAFGWLRTEIGVHRLVRKSPFDSIKDTPHLPLFLYHLILMMI